MDFDPNLETTRLFRVGITKVGKKSMFSGFFRDSYTKGF
jgi:hypothetical protein